MAERITIVDDITDEEGASTRIFGWDGQTYEIDLTDASAAKLEALLEPYIKAGRARRSFAMSKRSGKAPKNLPPQQREQLEAIRAWWRSQGGEVSDRGRIPAHVMKKFQEAHQPTASLPKRPAKKTAETVNPAFSAAGT